jgi:2'-5' RNA ligase superfamily
MLEIEARVIRTRKQLSMYVPSPDGIQLELVREALDPVQAGLIPAHVTLCREDEIDQLSTSEIEATLRSSALRPVTLCFGRPVIFQGHGVLLPCVAGEQAFHQLRTHVLGTTAIRRHAPHITLAHPRNPPSSKSSLADAMGLPDNLSYTFAKIAYIEQIGAAPWRVLQGFTLRWR